MPNWWDSYEAVQDQGGGAAPATAAPGTMSYYDNFARSPSTALPQGGDPTSFTGSSAGGMTTPGRYDPETMRAFAIDLMANGGKGAASILQGDPGQQYAKSYATTQAANQAGLDFKQKMTDKMTDIIHGVRDKLDAAGPDIADMATGPDYGQLSDDPSAVERLVKAPLPDTSGEFYQNARAGLRDLLNLPGQFIPGVSDYTQYWADKGNKARNLNLELHHLVKGIGAGVKAIPGTKNGGTSTDADQALVLDAVGEAMHAADTPTRNNILFDAENILRARAGQPRLPPPPGYQPSSLGMRYGATSPTQNSNVTAPPAVASRPAAAARTAPGYPPPEAIRQLRQNSSAKNRAYFDQIFGAGASSRAMRGAFGG